MILPIVQNTYEILGCDTEFMSYPVEQALELFNHGQISGELYRAPFIESQYTVPFVRTDAPIRLVKTGLWLRPSPHVNNRHLVGYVRGVKWQARYVETFSSDTLNIQFKAFTHYLEMFENYQNDRLYGFLATDACSQVFRYTLDATEQPDLNDAREIPLNHYLSTQYIDFMEDFNAEMIRNPITAQYSQ